MTLKGPTCHLRGSIKVYECISNGLLSLISTSRQPSACFCVKNTSLTQPFNESSCSIKDQHVGSFTTENRSGFKITAAAQILNLRRGAHLRSNRCYRTPV